MSSYMVQDPGNGQMRRYNVSDYARRAWSDLASKWPHLASSDLMDAFEQEYERTCDACSWSGSYIRARDTLEILLDLAEKKASGKF
jgi:hypothetical protein